MNDEMKPILTRLVAARQRKYSQRDVALALKLINQQQLSRIERGVRPLTVEMLLHLTRLYGVSTCWIITGEQHMIQIEGGKG